MIAGDVKAGDAIVVEADKDGKAVFVVNGKRVGNPEEKTAEPVEKPAESEEKKAPKKEKK